MDYLSYILVCVPQIPPTPNRAISTSLYADLNCVIKYQFNMELLFQLRELVIKYLICSIKPY